MLSERTRGLGHSRFISSAPPIGQAITSSALASGVLPRLATGFATRQVGNGGEVTGAFVGAERADDDFVPMNVHPPAQLLHLGDRSEVASTICSGALLIAFSGKRQIERFTR